MKTKGQREQLLGGSEFRWPVFLGLTMAWRSLLTEIPAEGSIPSSSTVLNPPRKRLEPPTGIVLGYEPRTGFGNPLFILALLTRRKQGQNDVPQLSDRVQTVWKDSARSSAFPLPHMRQDVQRICTASTRRHARSAGSCFALLATDCARKFDPQHGAYGGHASLYG